MRKLLALLAALVCWPVIAATSPTPSADEGGKWQLTLNVSPQDGSKAITARLAADEAIPSGFDKVTPELVILYRSGQMTAYVLFDTFLGHDKLDATVKFGAQPPEKQRWTISADERSLYPPGEAFAFVERLKTADHLAVTVAPHRNAPVTAQFTLAGIQVVMKALISAGVKYAD